MTIKSIISPSLGLYLGMSPLQVPNRALIDCLNIRIKQGKIRRDNLGWAQFPDSENPINLDNKPVTLIDAFQRRDGVRQQIFGNTTDLFTYDDDTGALAYLTPVYVTGTVDVTNGSATVTGTSTSWNDELKAGDQIHVGADDQTDPSAAWYEIDSVDSDTQVTLTENYAETTASGEDYTARIVFTGDQSNPFITEPFYEAADVEGGDGDRWYAVNGVDAVVAWDGSTTHAYYPDLGNVDTCRYLRRDKNRMVYVAPTTSGELKKYSIRTSDTGKPEDTAAGEAAEFIVHDRADELVAAEPIGDMLALYGKQSITLAQYIGLPLIYAFRAAVVGDGPISGRGIAVFPDYHLFIGVDSQYIFDGARATPTNTHVWRDVLRRVSPSRHSFLHCYFDEEQGELLWVTPLTTDAEPEDGPAEQAFNHHYLEGLDSDRTPDPHTRRELPALVFGPYERQDTISFDVMTEQWKSYNYRWNDKFFFAQFPQTLFGDDSGNIYVLNEDPTKAGTEMQSFARFSRIPIGSIEQKAVVRRIYPLLTQIVGSDDMVEVELYGTNTPEGAATLTSNLSFSALLGEQEVSTGMNTSRHFVSPRKSARFIEVLIGTEDGTAYWELNGYAVDTIPGGFR